MKKGRKIIINKQRLVSIRRRKLHFIGRKVYIAIQIDRLIDREKDRKRFIDKHQTEEQKDKQVDDQTDFIREKKKAIRIRVKNNY